MTDLCLYEDIHCTSIVNFPDTCKGMIRLCQKVFIFQVLCFTDLLPLKMTYIWTQLKQSPALLYQILKILRYKTTNVLLITMVFEEESNDRYINNIVG